MVAAAFTIGLSLPLLIAAGVVSSGVQAVFDPALQAVVPRLMPDPHRLRALNGLFDVTGRLAVIAGSALGAAIASVAPTIHLLTANSASFLASDGVVYASSAKWITVSSTCTAGPASPIVTWSVRTNSGANVSSTPPSV